MNNIPEGYLKDGKANLVAIANVKQTDLIKDEFVQKACAKALEMQEKLAEFKRSLMAEADDFIEL